MRRRLSEASDWAQPVDVTAPAPPETDEELKKEKGRDVLEKLKTTQKQLLQLQLGIKQQQLEKLKARMRGKRSRNTFFPARPRRLPAQPATSAGASPEPSKPPPILADASASAASPPRPKERSEQRPPTPSPGAPESIQASQAPKPAERSQVIPKLAEPVAPAKRAATPAPAAPAAPALPVPATVAPTVHPALRPAALKKGLADAYFEKKAQAAPASLDIASQDLGPRFLSPLLLPGREAESFASGGLGQA